MARLTTKDYREILDLVYLSNRCESIESFIYTLFPSLLMVFRAECVTFHLIKGYPSNIKILESRSFKTDGRNIYEDKYYPVLYKDSFYKCSPLLKEAMSSFKTVLKFGESISFEEWERSNLYNEFISPQHYYWELFLTLRWKNKLEGMVTLWRSKKQSDYEDRDVLKAANLATHLGVAVHNICLVSQLNTPEKRYAPDDIDNENDGILCLDHEFIPYVYNSKAIDICSRLSSSRPSNELNINENEFDVPCWIIKDCAELFSSLKSESSIILPHKERIISTPNGSKFRIEYSLIWRADMVDHRINYLVTLSDLTDEKRLEANFQAKFNLSRRELDVINYLIKGLSDNEISEKLCISRQTVHTHIKNIYRKLCVRNRIELYRQVMQSRYPVIASEQLHDGNLYQRVFR